jgi:DNA polymerase sigma
MLLLHYLQTRPSPVVPNLQRLPPEWNGQVLPPNISTGNPNSHEIELNPFDQTPCKTYFYSPPSAEAAEKLSKYGSNNKESLAELLAGFFAYYSYDFNFRHAVVSIQSGAAVSKMAKVSSDLSLSGAGYFVLFALCSLLSLSSNSNPPLSNSL